ncbi:MAG: HEAT repeat domain-containing protein [Vicinamibacterales bacterium]
MTESCRRSSSLFLVLLSLAVVAAGCGAAALPPKPPTIPFEQKMAWILQLEDQRLLRLEPPPPPAPPVVPAKGRAPKVAPAPPAPPPIDLVALLNDTEPRIRRRAAMAIGRVGLTEGVPPLVGLMVDKDPEVRETAAFALGLIGDPAAVAPLTAALADLAPLVRGRAAEAIGLIATTDPEGGAAKAAALPAAPAIAKLALELARSAPVTAMQPDDDKVQAAPEAEAFKLALFALVRLGAYEPLESAVLDAGKPISSWWPVAYALQRLTDKRALQPLKELAGSPSKYTTAFAVSGLGRLRDPSSAPLILPLLDGTRGLEVTVSAIRAAAQVGAAEAIEPLTRIAADASAHPNLRLESVAALGRLKGASALPILQDLITDAWPVMRIAATSAAAAIDPESLIVVLSSLEPDQDWTVRAALAGVLATLPADVAVDRLRAMLDDQDKRVIPAVLRALVRHKVPDASTLVLGKADDADYAVRAAVADLIGELKPAGGAEALRGAYKRAQSDLAYDARESALAALASFGASEATETVKAALADKEWAVRLRAVQLLRKLDPSSDHQAAIRPAPGTPPAAYDDRSMIAPEYSPHVFIETAKGTIEFELAVLDAPQTSRNFITLARKGFFNGLAIHRVVPNFVIQGGDSRGDGGGGPGYTIRDELNERPYVRGTVGMALAGKDTGGSQFYIAHSPQPHLDGKYTAFGQVVNGMDVVDRIQQGDVIQRIRVWDGKGWQ